MLQVVEYDYRLMFREKKMLAQEGDAKETGKVVDKVQIQTKSKATGDMYLCRGRGSACPPRYDDGGKNPYWVAVKDRVAVKKRLSGYCRSYTQYATVSFNVRQLFED